MRSAVSRRLGLLATTALAALATRGSEAFEGAISPENLDVAPVYSPFAGRDFPDEVLFGDLHFHTEISFDAGLVGTSVSIDEALRVARGEEIRSNTGQRIQLIRPLDFLAVTEHAEMIGISTAIRTADPRLLADDWGGRIFELFNSGQDGRMAAFGEIIQIGTMEGRNPIEGLGLDGDIWLDIVETLDQYNEPGVFTSLSGFEWSSTPLGDNLHRVVLFADGAERTSQTEPFPLFDNQDPENLWDYLAGYEAQTGGRAISVPHNGNLSNGRMFEPTQFDGSPIDADYAAKRARWEPLHEMTQIKGDEETHPVLSPDDEFADFERWDVSNLAGSAPKTPEMLKYEYARSALKVGLELERETGINPFKSGFTGTTDAHTGLPTTREDNYFGKYQHTEPSPNRHDREVIPSDDPALRILTAQESAAGLTAVWARENTREEVFSALTRKETYATTGSRIRVRVFGGWEFEADDVGATDFVANGYLNGVPMGGDLRAMPEGGTPRFVIQAARDPDGANLDRVQIIKGWIDASGETFERVFDVAVSGDRVIGEDGRAREPVGSTVNIENATYTNTIGAPFLSGFWQDPEFDAAQDAFYYVRVIEIPIPRWTTHDAAFFGVPLPESVPAEVQDRAYTSPIWYSAEG